MSREKRRLRWMWIIFCAAVLSAVAAAQRPVSLAQTVAVGHEVGQQAPDFTLPQLDGEPVSLHEVVAQHDVTLLYFFFAAT